MPSDADQDTLEAVDPNAEAEGTPSQESPQEAVEEPSSQEPDEATQVDEGSEADQPDDSLTADQRGDAEEPPQDAKPEMTELERLEKRRADAQRWAQEEQRKRREYEERLAELEKQIQESQTQRQQADLPAFKPESPKFKEWQQKRPLVEQFMKQMQAVRGNEELEAQIAESWRGTISEDDVRTFQTEQREHQLFQQRLATNPREALADFVREEAANLLRKQQEEQATYQHYQALYQKPEVKELLSDPQNLQLYVKMVQERNWEPESAIEQIRMASDLKRLQGEAVKGAKAEASAKAQRVAAKGRAKVDQDVPVGGGEKPRDLFAEARQWAKENGHAPLSTAHMNYLRKLEQQA